MVPCVYIITVLHTMSHFWVGYIPTPKDTDMPEVYWIPVMSVNSEI